jgi:hypothetical protein
MNRVRPTPDSAHLDPSRALFGALLARARGGTLKKPLRGKGSRRRHVFASGRQTGGNPYEDLLEILSFRSLKTFLLDWTA